MTRERKIHRRPDLSAEAWAVTVSLGTQGTLSMLKALLLAASMSGSEVD